jgi:hypothetical protein
MGAQEAIFGAIVATAAESEQPFLERNRTALIDQIGEAFQGEGCVVDCVTKPAVQDGDLWRGAETTVFYPGAKGLAELAAEYALIPAGRVIQSNDPFSFAPNPQFPRELQERPYERDQLEQIKVIRQADNLQPSFLINSNPDAVNGPPIVDAKGLVLGGNSRVMSIKRNMAAYSPALAERLPQCGGAFGLNGAPTDGMILVRRLMGEYDPVSISRDLNRSLTQSLDLSAQAVSLGKLLPKELFGVLGDAMFNAGETATIMDALGSASSQVIKILQSAKVLTAQNYGDYVKKEHGRTTGQLSSTGRALVRSAIMGAFVGDKEYMMLLTVSMEKLIEQIACPLLILHSEGGPFDLVPAMRPAIGLISYLGARNVRAIEQEFGTGELGFEGEGDTTFRALFPQVFTDPLTAIMCKWLAEAQVKPRVAYGEIRDYVNRTPGRAQVSMFGEQETPEDLRRRVLKVPSLAEVGRIGIERWLAGLDDRRKNPDGIGEVIFEALKEGSSAQEIAFLDRNRAALIGAIEEAFAEAIAEEEPAPDSEEPPKTPVVSVGRDREVLVGPDHLVNVFCSGEPSRVFDEVEKPGQYYWWLRGERSGMIDTGRGNKGRENFDKILKLSPDTYFMGTGGGRHTVRYSSPPAEADHASRAPAGARRPVPCGSILCGRCPADPPARRRQTLPLPARGRAVHEGSGVDAACR